MVTLSPHPEKSLNLLRNQYKQMSLLFASGIVWTVAFFQASRLPVVHQLTFTSPDYKALLLYKLMELSPSGFKGQTLWRFVFPTCAPWYFSFTLCRSFRRQLPVTALPNLSRVASSLHLVVEFVLPIFEWLSGLLT